MAITIENNIIDSNTASDTYGGGGGVFSIADSIIKNNIISNNTSPWQGGGIRSGNDTILKNVITNNSGLEGGGIMSFFSKIKCNSIKGNSCQHGSALQIYSGTISENDFSGNNGTYTFYKVYADDINVPNNYWGTTDPSMIDDMIYDFYNDMQLGKVLYLPVLSESPEFCHSDTDDDGDVDGSDLANIVNGVLHLLPEVADSFGKSNCYQCSEG